jgi:TolB protein
LLCPSEIYLMDIDGQNKTRLTENEFRDNQPRWSPDGTQIVFVSNRDDPDCATLCDTNIYVMNADGSDIRRITAHPAQDRDPDWSPDGTLITFASDRFGTLGIFVMDTDGGNSRPVIPTDEFSDWYPRWSPDGRSIAYLSDRTMRQTNTSGADSPNILLIELDGSSESVQITNHTIPKFRSPSWSPDGRRFIATGVTSCGRDCSVYYLIVVEVPSNLADSFADLIPLEIDLNLNIFEPDWWCDPAQCGEE